MCGFLGIDLFGAKKAAKIQAAATLKSAEMQAAADREAARGAALSMTTTIAQKRATDQAAELLQRPQQGANVVLAPDRVTGQIDPATGRRRSARSRFFKSSNANAI